jgi:molecular chaperone GrpE
MKEHKKEKNSEQNVSKDAVTDKVKAEESEKSNSGKKYGMESSPDEQTSQKEIEELEEEKQPEENLNEKIDALNDKYIRLAAEFDNYRRRTAKERLELITTAAEDTIAGILPVLDDCERALEVLRKSEGDNKAAIEGTELIYNKLYTYLESKGLKKMEPLGNELDTDFHEAVAQYPAPDKKSRNKIINVVQNGYLLRGKVIRFAKVIVGI